MVEDASVKAFFRAEEFLDAREAAGSAKEGDQGHDERGEGLREKGKEGERSEHASRVEGPVVCVAGSYGKDGKGQDRREDLGEVGCQRRR